MNVEIIAKSAVAILAWIKSPDSRSEGNYDRADNYRAPFPVLVSWADLGLLKGKIFPVEGLFPTNPDDPTRMTDAQGKDWTTHMRHGLAVMGIDADHKFATTDPKVSALEGIVSEAQNLAAMRAQIRAEVLAEMGGSVNGDAPASDVPDATATATAPTGKSASKTSK